MRTRLAVLVAGVLVFGAAEASAQVTPPQTTPSPAAPARDRGFINVNAGGEAKSTQEGASASFSLYDESGTASVTREIKGGAFPDVMVGARIHGNFGLALQASMRSANADAATTASVPDPLAYESPRLVTGTLAGMVHKDFLDKLKFARVWGSAVHDGTQVKGDYVLHDKDVVELHVS